MPVYSYDHIHLRTRDPMATAQYYQRMFDAKIIESIQSDGRPRIDLDINGLTVFLAHVPAEADIPSAPVEPHLGLVQTGLDEFVDVERHQLALARLDVGP